MLSIPISVGPQSNLVRDWAQTGDQLLLLYLSAKNNRFICLFLQHIFVEHLLCARHWEYSREQSLKHFPVPRLSRLHFILRNFLDSGR